MIVTAIGYLLLRCDENLWQPDDFLHADHRDRIWSRNPHLGKLNFLGYYLGIHFVGAGLCLLHVMGGVVLCCEFLSIVVDCKALLHIDLQIRVCDPGSQATPRHDANKVEALKITKHPVGAILLSLQG